MIKFQPRPGRFVTTAAACLALFLASAPAHGTPIRILVDFGPSNDDDGRATSNPDANGNNWNSWRPIAGGASIPIGTTLSGLIDTAGNATGIGLEVTTAFTGSNGILNGGLDAPDGPQASLLGDFAIETATEDYFFDTANGAFKLTGLDASDTYRFRFFGTREFSGTRETLYTVTGANVRTANLVTSGLDIGDNGTYDGNDDEIIGVGEIIPDGSSEIFVDVAQVAGGFAYIGIMEITIVPEPSTLCAAILGLLGLTVCRRRRSR